MFVEHNYVLNIHAPCRFFETDKVAIHKAFHCGIINAGAGAKIVYSPERVVVSQARFPIAVFSVIGIA